MTRPRGEIRQVLEQAYDTLAERQGAATWREAAQLAQVGYAVAKETSKNMERAGHLEVTGSKQVPWSCRPMKLYAPPRRQSWVTGGPGLGDVLRVWVRA